MIQDSPLVSVIIPTYNRSQFLVQAVESVLNQTFADYEILIIDDGSTDDTASVCARFTGPVRCITQENQGRAAARNRGIQEARGEYIAFLDDDDLFEPDHLQLQVDFLKANPELGMAYGTYILVDEALNPLIEYHPDSAITYPEMLYQTIHIATPTVMLRRPLAERVGLFDPRFEIVEELDYFVRVAKLSRIGEIHQPLARVRQHAGNSERGANPKVFRNMLRLLDKHLQTQPDGTRSDVGWRLRYDIYSRFFTWWMIAWLESDDEGQKIADEYFGRAWPYLPMRKRGRLAIARMLFRKLVPDTFKQRLRPLWRKS